MHANVESAREGRFPVRPGTVTGGLCTTHCEFGRLCRLTRAAFRKPGADEIAFSPDGETPDDD